MLIGSLLEVLSYKIQRIIQKGCNLNLDWGYFYNSIIGINFFESEGEKSLKKNKQKKQVKKTSKKND